MYMKNKYRELKKAKKEKDWEVYHMIREEILDNFIMDTALDKFTKKELVTIATFLKEKIILDKEVDLWFS